MNLSSKYGYAPSEEAMAGVIQSIASNLDNMQSVEVLKSCFSMMDLTTLHTCDTENDVRNLVSKVNELQTKFPEYPLPASVCVFPNFASVVKGTRTNPELHVTTVAACFPTSQSYLEVKIMESCLAVKNGADEVDIVLALNSFMAQDYAAASDEIAQIRKAIDKEAASQGRSVILKVILETGELKSSDLIAEASFLAMEAGADFIKTSTGKVSVNATPVAAYVMCECIKAFYERTGRKVGFKAAGGISNAKDALCYYFIVSAVLGPEWLNKDLFRLGVSRLGNSLMSSIEGETINYF